MAAPGPRPRPPLTVVREGNPGKRAVKEGVKLPPAELAEPDWLESFPAIRLPPDPKEPQKPGPDAGPAEQDRYDRALERYENQLDRYENQVRAQKDGQRCREVARREWRRVVPVLRHTAGLAEVDATILADYCLCVARIDQGERSLSRDGALMRGERGTQKNGWTTIVGQYRQQLRAYIGELGLSPSARGRLAPPEGGDDDDDAFD